MAGHSCRACFDRLFESEHIFNGSVKTVVVWKLDRLSRRLRDGINLLADCRAGADRRGNVWRARQEEGRIRDVAADRDEEPRGTEGVEVGVMGRLSAEPRPEAG